MHFFSKSSMIICTSIVAVSSIVGICYYKCVAQRSIPKSPEHLPSNSILKNSTQKTTKQTVPATIDNIVNCSKDKQNKIQRSVVQSSEQSSKDSISKAKKINTVLLAATANNPEQPTKYIDPEVEASMCTITNMMSSLKLTEASQRKPQKTKESNILAPKHKLKSHTTSSIKDDVLRESCTPIPQQHIETAHANTVTVGSAEDSKHLNYTALTPANQVTTSSVIAQEDAIKSHKTENPIKHTKSKEHIRIPQKSQTTSKLETAKQPVLTPIKNNNVIKDQKVFLYRKPPRYTSSHKIVKESKGNPYPSIRISSQTHQQSSFYDTKTQDNTFRSQIKEIAKTNTKLYSKSSDVEYTGIEYVLSILEKTPQLHSPNILQTLHNIQNKHLPCMIATNLALAHTYNGLRDILYNEDPIYDDAKQRLCSYGYTTNKIITEIGQLVDMTSKELKYEILENSYVRYTLIDLDDKLFYPYTSEQAYSLANKYELADYITIANRLLMIFMKFQAQKNGRIVTGKPVIDHLMEVYYRAVTKEFPNDYPKLVEASGCFMDVIMRQCNFPIMEVGICTYNPDREYMLIRIGNKKSLNTILALINLYDTIYPQKSLLNNIYHGVEICCNSILPDTPLSLMMQDLTKFLMYLKRSNGIHIILNNINITTTDVDKKDNEIESITPAKEKDEYDCYWDCILPACLRIASKVNIPNAISSFKLCYPLCSNQPQDQNYLYNRFTYYTEVKLYSRMKNIQCIEHHKENTCTTSLDYIIPTLHHIRHYFVTVYRELIKAYNELLTLNHIRKKKILIYVMLANSLLNTQDIERGICTPEQWIDYVSHVFLDTDRISFKIDKTNRFINSISTDIQMIVFFSIAS
ncbi:hypothetical protein NEOKW01_0458 [Nematocida sp. AWRm80]|nr:hypothetical protein NEOKW01_0458 [Nematocida sp. AWRm80]